MSQTPFTTENFPNEALPIRSVEKTVQQADIQRHMNATYSVAEESLGIPVDKIQDGAYLYRFKICGFCVFQLGIRRNGRIST